MAAGFFCKTSRFGGLCLLVRCVVATVVTVLAAMVVVRAVFLMVQPQELQLRIPGSSVLIRRVYKDQFFFSFYLTAKNHRGRSFIYYDNITIQLVDSNINTIIAKFNLTEAIALSQEQEQDYYYYYLSKTQNMTLDPRYVEKLFTQEASIITVDVAMEVGGRLTEYGEGLTNDNVYRATYNCPQLKLTSNRDLLHRSDPKKIADCARN